MNLPRERNYRYYDLIMAAYVCILLCANLIGPSKVATVQVPVIGSVTFVAGVLFFPISYIFGDILTEVYGYARDRRCVWAGFAALAFAAFMASVIVALPPAAEWRDRAFTCAPPTQGQLGLGPLPEGVPGKGLP